MLMYVPMSWALEYAMFRHPGSWGMLETLTQGLYEIGPAWRASCDVALGGKSRGARL